MAEWLLEVGIGETRAALVDDGRIVEARIWPDGELIAGTVLAARLVARMPSRGQGVVAWPDGALPAGEALVTPMPTDVAEGAMTLVEIVRPAIAEPGKPKRALARPAPPGARPSIAMPDAPGARIVHHAATDEFEAAGWSELLDEAASGSVAFAGGALSVHLTPAMTLIDIDGTLASAALAVTGAEAAARAIRRLDIGGSIGVDLPGGGDKTARHAAAAAIDAVLPPPFERTAVNGFGFVQIVRRRPRRSLAELYATDRAAAHARALVRRAERVTGRGPRIVTAHPAVLAGISATWQDTLAGRIGAPVDLRPDPALAISAGHVQARHA